MWHDRSVPQDLISDQEHLPKQSHCSIEVDIHVQNILNRRHVKAREIHHDFVERKHPFDPSEKLVNSMIGLWRDETKRRKVRMGDLDPGTTPFPPDVLVSVSADPRNSDPGGWIHEEEYRGRIQSIMEDEKSNSDGSRLGFDSFVDKTPLEEQVQTSLESVEDLYPHNINELVASQRLSQNAMTREQEDEVQVENVDERQALSSHDEDFTNGYGGGHPLGSGIRNEQQADADAALLGWLPPHAPKAFSAHDKVSLTEVPETVGEMEEMQGPSSSTELENFGIRNAGDYSHADEDMFKIPAEFGDDINDGVRRHERTMNGQEQPRKRRKVAHDERPTSRPGSRSGFDGPPSILGINDGILESLDNVLQPRESYDGIHVTSPGARHNVTSSPAASQSQGSQKSKGRSSQQTLKANDLEENKSLQFPVVKNPYDPRTIARISQKSNPPAKSIEKSPTRSNAMKSADGTDLVDASTQSSLTNGNESMLSVYNSQTQQVSSKLRQSFNIPVESTIRLLKRPPPISSSVLLEIQASKDPTMLYQDAFYSDEKDVPERSREYAGKEFKIESGTVPYLADFDPTGTSSASRGNKPNVVIEKHVEDQTHTKRRRGCALRAWETCYTPPKRQEVQAWLDEEASRNEGTTPKANNVKATSDTSQIEAATQKNKHGFKYSQKQDSTSVQHETQYMSAMSLEIHVNSRGSLLPNPEHDEISCIFWCLQTNDDEVKTNEKGNVVGVLALSTEHNVSRNISRLTAAKTEEEGSELQLINRMIDIVRNYDPDILTGYEVHNGSWGYMIERARFMYDFDLCDEFSRMKSNSHGRFGKDNDRWGFNHTSTIRVTGRHMINIWRAMRAELNLLQYTMENVVFHLLHRRIPHYSHQDLTTWYTDGKPKDLAKVVDYYISRVRLDLEILEQNELIPRTSEQARLLGVDFYSVFSRGSQFKVESLMFRIAKPENLLLPSPSRKQVGQQNALECLPLVMEPQSAFYNSPLLVLDFQSLYPSVMIAYNYCYSTFLGRVVSWRGQNKMGFTDYQRGPRLLELFKDQINIAPNGIMYVRPEVRKSLLAKMLGEILETRVMVKSGMKIDKDDRTLQRLLNNRQLALKLIANVTYGYTSASFSGRMPCSEIADSIVQTGRETLEKAIALIHSVERWGAEVVYGDTDSLFVYLKGRTKDEAFDIGNEIAKTITDLNPRPVKLKFEKVYFPCVLLAKKRYVGFKYESKDQKEPEFDAKGIETVRRDGTPAEQKIEENALKILFRTADLSQVKAYFQRQCIKIMKGRVSIQDFCFAKEVRLGTYSDNGLPPPGALISTKRMLADPRAEPQYGERVPYVVITGAPGARLIDRCVAPEVLLHNDQNELDAEYYISKNLIPPLERIFNLMGANVRQWYDEMPKFQRIRRIGAPAVPAAGEDTKAILSKKTIESYMKSSSCLLCREKLEDKSPICSRCLLQSNSSLLTLVSRMKKAQRKAVDLESVCRSCAGLAFGETVKCDSKDCGTFYSRTRHMAGLRSTKTIVEPIIKALEEREEGSLEW